MFAQGIQSAGAFPCHAVQTTLSGIAVGSNAVNLRYYMRIVMQLPTRIGVHLLACTRCRHR